MPWSQKVPYLLGKPIGVSFTNGQGTSGILCSVQGGQVYLMEYLYHTQFATKHYPVSQIQDIHMFPGCHMPSPPLFQIQPQPARR